MFNKVITYLFLISFVYQVFIAPAIVIQNLCMQHAIHWDLKILHAAAIIIAAIIPGFLYFHKEKLVTLHTTTDEPGLPPKVVEWLMCTLYAVSSILFGFSWVAHWGYSVLFIFAILPPFLLGLGIGKLTKKLFPG